MKEILCFHLNPSDTQVLRENSDLFDGAQVKEYEKLSEALQVDIESCSAVFIHWDAHHSLDELERALQYFESVTTHLVFATKKYDQLLLAYKYKVDHIHHIQIDQAVFAKLPSLKDKGDKLFQENLSQLFSHLDKVKSNIDFYQSLSAYFASCSEIVGFSLVELTRDTDQVIGDELPSSFIQKLKQTSFPAKYVGVEFNYSDHHLRYTYSLAFNGEDQQLWMVHQFLKDQRTCEFLDPLFYGYVEAVMLLRQTKEWAQNMELLAKTDEVTGLFNQRKLIQDLEDAVCLHRENQESFSVLFLDVDHFKNVNDEFGHLVGSQLLRDIGMVLVNTVRGTDYIYRYGGDEFIVIMPKVNLDYVYDIAARILQNIKETEFKIENGKTYRLTLSIGIAEFPTDAQSAHEIIQFADEMMYMSKKSGRGRVFHINEVAHVSACSE